MRYFYKSDTHYFHEKLLGSNDLPPSVCVCPQRCMKSWSLIGIRWFKHKITVYHLGEIALIPNMKRGLQSFLALISTAARERSLLSKATMIRRALFSLSSKGTIPGISGEPKFSFADVGLLLKFVITSII